LLAPIHAAVAALAATGTNTTTPALCSRQRRSQREAKQHCSHPRFHKFTSAFFHYIFIAITAHVQFPLIPAPAAMPPRSLCMVAAQALRTAGGCTQGLRPTPSHRASSADISQLHALHHTRCQ